MAPMILRSPPSIAEYTSLPEHESRTPDSFFAGKPVLHYHATGAKAWLPASQRGISGLPFFPKDGAASAPSGDFAASLNGEAEELVEQTVDVFVTSESFILFSTQTESGIAIPYPSITLHAIKHLGSSSGSSQRKSAIYLQLELGNTDPDDEDFETTELTLVPPQLQPQTATPDPSTPQQAQSETSKLFDAISACSNLHPDPATQDDSDDPAHADDGLDDRIVFDHPRQTQAQALPGFAGAVLSGSTDGGLPPPMPGSGGWITAENMHQFFDGDGNWIGDGEVEEGGQDDGEEYEEYDEGVSGELGDGAGRVRTRDEIEGTSAEADGGQRGEVNGHGEGGDDAESKRIRTQ